MAKKAKKRITKSKRSATEWSVGQPLVFPPGKTFTDNDQLAQKVAKEAIRHPFKSKREKRKRK